MKIDQFRRAQDADPQSQQARTMLTIQRARTEGPQVYLENLTHRDLWNSTSKVLQDQAALEISRRLGSGFTFEGMRDWSCVVEPRCGDCGNDPYLGPCETCEFHLNSYTLSHRLALFTHVPTGIEFNLLPGCGLAFQPFLIGRWPITRKYFRPAKEYEDLPAVGIGFDYAVSILRKLGLSLPSHFEWEYACRAGASTRFYWGDEFDPSYCWYESNSGKHSLTCLNYGKHSTRQSCCQGVKLPHSPKEHEAASKWNAFGLVDMIGNVWEWCEKGIVAGSCFGSRASDIDSQLTSMASGEDHSYRGFRPVAAIPGLGA